MTTFRSEPIIPADLFDGPILAARAATEAFGNLNAATGDLRESFLNPALRWPALRITPQFVWFWKRISLTPSSRDLTKLHALKSEDVDGTWRLFCGLAVPTDKKRGYAERDRLDGVAISFEVCRVCAVILDGISNDEIKQEYLRRHAW